MKDHLTQKEIIEYQFKLASDIEMQRIAKHLEQCQICQSNLKRLKRKFASLDLLREDVKVSDDLIAQVLTKIEKPEKVRTIPIKWHSWIGATAAAIIIGLLLIANHLSKNTTPSYKDIVKFSEEIEQAEKYSITEDTTKESHTRKAISKEVLKQGPIESKKPFTKIMGADTTLKDKILEKPPFAPASAIELVTLPRHEKVQLTIYNSADLTLVRERRNLTLKEGWNWLQFMWANTLIDPTSLSIVPLEQADEIDIQQLVFPARLREVGRWLIHSQISDNVPFEITYFTSGLSWRAFYMGTFSEDEKTMRLQGYVRVANSSGEDYEDAQTRLIVGTVHILDKIAELARRQYPYNSPVRIRGAMNGEIIEYDEAKRVIEYGWSGDFAGEPLADMKYHLKKIVKEGLSEYFLYTIEGTETIPDKWGKRLISFEADDIAVDSLCKYDEERWGPRTIRFISFVNDKEHNLGNTPIPNGTVKIYSQADNEGNLSYVGGTGIKYIPVDEKVDLNLGPARLVTVEPILMDFKTDNYTFNKKGNIAGWDEIRNWKIEITNTRTLPIEIEITRGFDTTYWTLQFNGQNVSYEKHDATHARFKLNIEPRSKRTFEYTVTTYHGLREEKLTEMQKEKSES